MERFRLLTPNSIVRIFNVNYMVWIILTPGNGPIAEYDGFQCLGPRLGGLDVGGLVLTPGRVIPAALP